MKFIFHGAAEEVGRSCIEVKTKTEDFLLDAGLRLDAEGVTYPALKENFEKIDAVFLSHAHLDHSGALPLFHYYGMNCPIFCTSITRVLTKLLLKDSYNIELLENLSPAYSKVDIQRVMELMKHVDYSKEYRFKGLHYKYFDAAHIPGSSMIQIDSEKRILYTGDIKLSETRLLRASSIIPENMDVMISEATYGNRDHPNREEIERNFIKAVKSALDDNGSVLVPAFAVGRAQEIMLILKNENLGVDVYVDGMSNKATRSFVEYPEFIKDINEFTSALKKYKTIKSRRQRKEIIKEQGVFITTSGMLDGGPVIDYLKYMWHEPKNAILLTGYQAEGSNGRMLLDEGKVFVDSGKLPFKGTIKQFDFSAHIGRNELIRFIKKANPEKLIFVHGDLLSVKSMKQWADENGFEAYAPKLGDKITI